MSSLMLLVSPKRKKKEKKRLSFPENKQTHHLSVFTCKEKSFYLFQKCPSGIMNEKVHTHMNTVNEFVSDTKPNQTSITS